MHPLATPLIIEPARYSSAVSAQHRMDCVLLQVIFITNSTYRLLCIVLIDGFVKRVHTIGHVKRNGSTVVENFYIIHIFFYRIHDKRNIFMAAPITPRF